VNRIGRWVIFCMLLIAALAIIWNVLGPRLLKTRHRERAPSPLLVRMVPRSMISGARTNCHLGSAGGCCRLCT
jgi:hypothetical protein